MADLFGKMMARALNREAPPGHRPAFITEREAGVLRSLGAGVAPDGGQITRGGISSFERWDDPWADIPVTPWEMVGEGDPDEVQQRQDEAEEDERQRAYMAAAIREQEDADAQRHSEMLGVPPFDSPLEPIVGSIDVSPARTDRPDPVGRAQLEWTPQTYPLPEGAGDWRDNIVNLPQYAVAGARVQPSPQGGYDPAEEARAYENQMIAHRQAALAETNRLLRDPDRIAQDAEAWGGLPPSQAEIGAYHSALDKWRARGRKDLAGKPSDAPVAPSGPWQYQTVDELKRLKDAEEAGVRVAPSYDDEQALRDILTRTEDEFGRPAGVSTDPFFDPARTALEEGKMPPYDPNEQLGFFSSLGGVRNTGRGYDIDPATGGVFATGTQTFNPLVPILSAVSGVPGLGNALNLPPGQESRSRRQIAGPGYRDRTASDLGDQQRQDEAEEEERERREAQDLADAILDAEADDDAVVTTDPTVDPDPGIPSDLDEFERGILFPDAETEEPVEVDHQYAGVEFAEAMPEGFTPPGTNIPHGGSPEIFYNEETGEHWMAPGLGYVVPRGSGWRRLGFEEMEALKPPVPGPIQAFV